MTEHSDWLAQVEISGPFLAEPVLREAFPQGLEGLDTPKRQLLRRAYDEWREAIDLDDVDAEALHHAWIDLVLRQGLDYQGVIKSRDQLGESIRHDVAEHGVTLRPDHAIVGAGDDARPLCLISIYGPETNLTDVSKIDAWSASPADRMVDLCRAVGVRLGLVTNGEHWMLVDAPVGGVASFATWHARLWGQEPVTLQAFLNLLGVRRFFVDADHQLPALLDQSLEHQDEVTEALGEQVRRAIEVLIQALDRADVDRNRELLHGLAPRDIYEGALTVMMRIVFLLSAEERGLLLMGDERYEANYAVSTLRLQLRNEPPEILERRWDAWSRLLSIFRVVYGGLEHEALRLPALGGSLFDPDRFPFLEGRAAGTSWRSDLATPLPIDNRTVLLLLDAVQLFQGRTLSYRALDVEQIGHVYEGLLERTVARAEEATLDLDATKNARHPWVTLPELDAARAAGGTTLAELLRERTGSAASRVTNDLARAVEDADADRLLTACHGDQDLRNRLKPYFHLIRTDRWGYPLVYPKDAYMVASGSDRRETGAHYTPKSLTEMIVKETLEPIVYVGPAEGLPRENWKLKPPAQLLDLKVCDPAMGSGAFLVQACRYLSDRVVEAWTQADARGQAITAEGRVLDELGGAEPLPRIAEERLVVARRLVAERCLYGVDLNPLAVELAKLSIWLVTLAKARPFGFLDHNLRCGDSLLGITLMEQVSYLSVTASDDHRLTLFAAQVEQGILNALTLRSQLRNQPIRDIRDVETVTRLNEEARSSIRVIGLAADCLVGEALKKEAGVGSAALSADIAGALVGDSEMLRALARRASLSLRADLPAEAPDRLPLHWPLVYPEVFSADCKGFDAIVGNPPFMGGRKVSTHLGAGYGDCIKRLCLPGAKGSINLVMYFLHRAASLLKPGATMGMIATDTITQGETRDVGMTRLFSITPPYRAVSSRPWPGAASVRIALLHLIKGRWGGPLILNGQVVDGITTMLKPGTEFTKPRPLQANSNLCSDGVKVQGIGFVLNEAEALALLQQDAGNAQCLTRYIVGDDINNHPKHLSDRWVINFWNMSEQDSRRYTPLWDILEERVKPYRDSLTKQIHESCFWKFWDRREEFFDKVRGKRKVLVCSKLSKYFNVAFGDPSYIYSEKAKVFDFDTFSSFAVLQSVVHVSWARTWGSSTGETPAYVGSSCFDTFPFPLSMQKADRTSLELIELDGLKDIGARLEAHRSQVLIARSIGLTDCYNLVHDASCAEEQIVALRALHVELDEQVLATYGWGDIRLDHEFRTAVCAGEECQRFSVSEEVEREIVIRLIELNLACPSTEADKGALRAKSTKQRGRARAKSGADLFD